MEWDLFAKIIDELSEMNYSGRLALFSKNGMWTVVMSLTNIYSGQSYFWASDTSTLKAKIKEKWDAGYIITALEYGGGEFLCIMSKRKDGKATKEYWQVNPSNVSKHIKEYWDQYYNISYIGG